MLGSKVAPRTSLHAFGGVWQQTWMQKIWCTMLWTETFEFELYRVKLLQVNWNILDLRTWPHWQNVSFELHDWWAGLQNDCSLLPAGLQGATQSFSPILSDCGFAGVGFGNCCACFNCTGWVNIELNRFASNVLMSAWDLTWGVCILLDANVDTQAVLPQSFY